MFKKFMKKAEAVKNRVYRTVVKSGIRTLKELQDQSGASAVEIALAAVIAIVLACILLQAFTGIFSDSIIPGIKNGVSQMFSIGG
jgi:Flp pilus assembly pilin Flp